MGWLRRDRDDGPHPVPVEIDLGLVQRAWEIEMLVTQLGADGVRLHLTTQSQIPEMAGGLGPKRCTLLVNPADEARLRHELELAGWLEPQPPGGGG